MNNKNGVCGKKSPVFLGSSKLRAGNFCRRIVFAPIDDFAIFNLSVIILWQFDVKIE